MEADSLPSEPPGASASLTVNNSPTMPSRIHLQYREHGSIPGSGRSAGEGIRHPTPVFLGFPCGSTGKESTCNVGDLGSVSELGRSPGEGKDTSLNWVLMNIQT